LFALRIGRARKFIPGLVALLLVGLTYSVARIPFANASERSTLAAGYGFTELPIALPPGLPDRTIREVNPAYKRIQAWISAVGAAVALNDLDGNGRPDDLCLVDTRSDAVIVTPAPDTAARYAPFVLDPAPLPVHPAMAPMGCVPGDFNADGRMDVLAYYWGRTPILFMKKSDAPATLSAASYQHVEVIPQAPAVDGAYVGPRWNTNAVAIADFDGDGHPDIFVPNYFPDSDVLDASGLPNVQMQNTMSNAKNAGGAHMLRWIGSTAGPNPTARFQEDPKAVPFGDSSGWTLGAASADLDGDLLPELYIANDFGPDHLLHNVSTPGQIRFTAATASRTPTTPKSMALGHDSFKGMSVDFGERQARHVRQQHHHRLGDPGEQLRLDQHQHQRSRHARQAERRHGPVRQPRLRTEDGLDRLGLGRQDGRLQQQRLSGHRPGRRLRQGLRQPLELAAGTGHDQRRAHPGPEAVAERPGRRRHLRQGEAGLLGQGRQRRLRQHQPGARPRRADAHPGDRGRRHRW
jgi:hypothetical protein